MGYIVFQPLYQKKRACNRHTKQKNPYDIMAVFYLTGRVQKPARKNQWLSTLAPGAGLGASDFNPNKPSSGFRMVRHSTVVCISWLQKRLGEI